MNPESRSVLPKIAYDSFTSHLQTPTLDEGFRDITVVDFVVSVRDDVVPCLITLSRAFTSIQ